MLRDYAQRAVGHRVILAMAAAAVLSWYMASPVVALASVAAFSAGEVIDWLVYTTTRRPMHARVLLSSAIGVPVDTVIFLGIIGALTPSLVSAQLASKWAAAVLVSGVLWHRARARA